MHSWEDQGVASLPWAQDRPAGRTPCARQALGLGGLCEGAWPRGAAARVHDALAGEGGFSRMDSHS